MRYVSHIAFVSLMLALAFFLAGTPALRGQDAAPASSSSVVPPLIKFSGVIPSPGTQSLSSNAASARALTATFSLYALQEGGSPLWSESQSVQLDEQGHYVVLLGAASPEGLPLDLFTSGKALWLGVQPQLSGAGELPRVLLAAVPYALKAVDSETLGGKPASAYALAGTPTMVEVGAAPASASPTTTSTGSQLNAAAGSASSPQAGTPCAAVTSDGTATANSVAKFTAACNIENSLIRDTGTAVAVGGTATPGALLDVQFSSTAASGALLGQRVLTTLSPTGTSTASTDGLFSNVQTATGNTHNLFGNLYALNSEFDHYGTGKVTSGFGLNGAVVNQAAGTITNAYGVYASLSNASTGTITNGYGVYVNAPSNTGTFSKFTGLYIASPTAVVPGAYGVYSAGGTNYFNGNVGIATTTPGAVLEVNGTAKFDGLVTFKAGQTYPGAGTVTSVATGAGLKGGPITKTGTLSIATAGVTDAMLANAYSGVGTCAAGKLVSALTRDAAPTCITAGVGTIAGVTAGTDLTGGGTTGAVTLNLDTTKVPTLASAANVFSGSITASSFSGNGSTLTSLSPANLASGTAGISITGNAATATTAGSATTATTAGNATNLGGVAASNYARLDVGNSFNGNQSVAGNLTATGSLSGASAALTGPLTGTAASFSGALTAGAGALLPAMGTATAAAGANSEPLDLSASSFNSNVATAVNDDFRWQAEPAGNNTASPSGTLNLLFGAGGAAPAETGLAIASTGAVNVPSLTAANLSAGNCVQAGAGGLLTTTASACGSGGAGTVTSVGSGAGLTGGPITTSGTLSIATGGVTNAMLANPSLTILAGADLTGGGAVVLGGGTTLGLDTTKVPQLGTANTFGGTQTLSSGDVSLTSGNLDLPQTTGYSVGMITMGGTGVPFIHACCSAGQDNTFVGSFAGSVGVTGNLNTGMGSCERITFGIERWSFDDAF